MSYRPSRRDLLRSALVGGLAGPFAARSAHANAPVPTGAPQRLVTPYKFGLHVDEADFEANLAHAEELAGRKADVVLLFAKLTDPIDDTMQWLMSAGYEVILTLEFWSQDRLEVDPAYGLSTIVAGDHDADLAHWLRACRDLPRPVHLRVLHEFNGNWYPWGVYTDFNDPADFVSAWKHVVDRVRHIAGDRVLTQLCYNRQNADVGAIPLEAFYAGNDYVDELAIVGFMRPDMSEWLSFEELIGPTYDELKTFGRDKPIWIPETGCTEQGGDKAAWITDMFDTALTTLPVTCLTWFDAHLEFPGQPLRDWPFDSSSASLKAFQEGVKRT